MGNTPKFPSLASPLLILKGFWFWDQDAKILPCTMFRGPSAGPGRSVVSANNLDREVKGHGNFEHRPGSFGRIFSTWERVFVSVISMIYYVSIITLTWRDSCIKRWQFSQVPRFIQSSKVQHFQVSVTLVTFTHPERFLVLGTGCKDIALYNVQGSITRSWQISGQCKQSGSQREKAWTFWKEAGIFWKSLQHLGKGMWDMISINHDESMIYYVSIITLTWRDSCIKRWQFSTSTVYHPKLEWATLPSFRHFRHLHSSWKYFDTGIRMQAWCLVQCSVQCSGVHQLVSANNLDREVKRHGHFEKRPGSFGRVFNTWERVFVRYNIDDLLCIHYHLDVARQLHQEMAIFDEYLVSSKVRMSNTPKFPSLSSPSLILKGFWFWDQDARILLCTMFRGPSAGPGRSVVSANNLDREVKGHRKLEHRPASFGRVFNTSERACEIWYRLIMMNRWSIMYPLSPWRGETAPSRDGNFRRVPCIIQSWNEQHSQVSVTFVTFTHPERVLILGSGCKHDALYNVQYNAQGSISWSVQTIWIARWKGMDILKRGRDFLEESSKAGKGYLLDTISTIYYVSIITLTWLDSSIKRWQFSTSTLYHPKLEWATLPSFRHFRHLHSSWKAFDSWIRMQRWCLPQCSVQCSGVHQQFLADQWSVPTTGDGKIEQRQGGRDFLEESSTPGKGYLWDLISMIYYISIITLKYSFESGVKTHGCLSHEFAKTMQQCWTCRRFKRVLVCRTTHHERSGCIIVQMLSFPSPSIYTTWDEPWHIRMHHFFGSKLRSPIDNGLW